MIGPTAKSTLDISNFFPDEKSCIEQLEKLRWSGHVISPFDSSSKVYVCKGNRYKCKNTGKYFNAKTATLFDNTKIQLQKWFLAIHLVTNSNKRVSSLQLARDLGITQKTSWLMLQRINSCFEGNQNEVNSSFRVKNLYK